MKKTALCKRLLALFVCVFAFVSASAQVSGNTLTITKDNVTKNLSDFGDLSNVTTIKLVGDFPNGWNSGILPGSAAWKSQITSIDLSAANFSATTETVTGERPSTQHSISNSWTFEGFTNSNLTITWPTKSSITVLPEKAFYGCGMQSVTIPSSVVTIGKFAFGTCRNLQSVTFTEPTSVQYLLESCFKETGLTSISIPGTVKEIQTMAFQNSGAQSPLTSIHFKEAKVNGESIVDMKIATDAFNNNFKILDVYIETMGTITAEADAFPKDITYGQTNPNNPMATLHFPDEKVSLYANLEHELKPSDIATDAAFQVWLNDHNTKATEVHNGFYQFVNNGSSSSGTPIEGRVVLRTFSHATIDYIMPKGAKAFIVTSVSSDDNGKTYKLNLKKVDVIPAGTGVIIYGGTNTKAPDGVNNTLSMTAVNYTGTAFTRTSLYQGEKNLLVGSSSVNGVACNGVEIYPYEMENGVIAWRNFVLSKFSKSDSGKAYLASPNHAGTGDFFGFFRTKHGTIGSGKAYLRLSATEFPKSTGGEVIVPQIPVGNYGCYEYRKEYKAGTENTIMTESEMQQKLYWYTKQDDSDSKILWENDWGVRNLDSSFTMAKFDGEPFIEIEEEGVATLIVPSSMVEIADTESYYTLQGVKVSNPSKGVYVKNGKKVVIK